MNSYKVPEGYFDDLKIKLEAIPGGAEKTKAPVISIWQKVQPYMALAACFAIALVAGSLFLGRGPKPSGSLEFQDYYYSQLQSVENPYAIYDESYEGAEALSEDDIVEYLIASGASTDYVAYMLNQ